MYHNPTDASNAVKLPLDQDAWLLFRFDNHEVIRLHLRPGESIDNHTNDWRIVFFVIGGKGTLNVEGNSFYLATGQSIAVKAGMKRFWNNTGDLPLELLVIKTEAGR